LLDTVLAWLLPCVVLEGEEDDLRTDSVLDRLDGSGLVGWGWAGETIAVTCAGPAGLHDVGVLATADRLQDGDLGLDKVSSLLGRCLCVEEGVQVTGDNVDDRAEGSRVGLVFPDGEGFCGGDKTSVALCANLTFDGADEVGKVGGRAVAIEDSFVANDDKLDEVPLSPGKNVGHLTLSTRNTGAGNKDAENHLQAVLAGSSADVCKSGAISAVDTNASESITSNLGNIRRYSASVLALSSSSVWRVGHGPLVAVRGDSSASRAGRAGRGALS